MFQDFIESNENSKFSRMHQQSLNHIISALKLDQLSVDELIELMAKGYGVEHRELGWGQPSAVYQAFIRFEQNASIDTCLDLIKNHNKVGVKAYAYLALVHKKYEGIFEIIRDSLQHSELKVHTMIYDIGDTYFLPDFFITYSANTLSMEQLVALAKAIVELECKIKYRQSIFTHLDPDHVEYGWIKSHVETNNDPYGLVLLAKYHEDADTSLILQFGKEHPLQTFQAIAQFPHPAFWEFIVEQISVAEHLQTNYRWVDLFKAISAYKNDNSQSVLEEILKYPKTTDTGKIFPTLIFNALQSQFEPFYENLYWLLWKKYGHIDKTIFHYLVESNHPQAIEIIISTISNQAKLKQLIDNAYWSDRDWLIFESLNTLKQHDQKLVNDVLYAKFDDYDYFSLDKLIDFMLTEGSDKLVDKVFDKLKSTRESNIRHLIGIHVRKYPKYWERLVQIFPNMLDP